MTSRLSKLVAAAVLASSLPAAALAHDGDRGQDLRPVVVSPAPREGWRVDPRDHGRLAARERELASCRADLRALDAARAGFHARYAGQPGRLRRYDRWYLERRVELERRMGALRPVAWR